MPEPPVLTQRILDLAGCDEPGCDHDHSVLVLIQRCHPRAGLQVEYHKARGVLRCACQRCQRPVYEIAVAYDEGEVAHV